MRIGVTSFARGTALCLFALARRARSAIQAAALPWVSTSGRAAAVLVFFEENIVAERDRWFPWAVVGFVGGSLVYFALKGEPSPIFAGIVACLGVAMVRAALATPAPLHRFLCVMLAASCFGFSAAKLRTSWVDAPIIASDIGPLRLEGRIESVFVQDDTHARILFAP